jgi:hypothetical protein
VQYNEEELYEEEFRPAPRRGNFLRLLAYALLIGAGWGAWQMHRRGISPAASAPAVPALAAPVQAAAPATTVASPAVPAQAAAPAAAVRSQASTESTDPGPEAQPAPVPPPPAARQRRFYGVVYDLATTRPVAGASLTFDIGSRPPGPGREQSQMTDAAGYYLADFPEDADKLTVSVQAAGYGGQLEDIYPPLRRRSESERRALLSRRDDYLGPVRVLFTPSQEVVPLDLVVVPQDWLPQTQPGR